MTNATPFPKYDIVLSYDAPSDEGALLPDARYQYSDAMMSTQRSMPKVPLSTAMW